MSNRASLPESTGGRRRQPKSIARRRLTVDNPAEAVRGALSARVMQQNAADLEARIRAENGIAQAVAAIEQKWGHRQGYWGMQAPKARYEN